MSKQPKKVECEDCGTEIPAARLKLTQSTLCVACQEMLERQGLAPRFRMEVLGARDVDSYESCNAVMTKLPPRKALGASESDE